MSGDGLWVCSHADPADCHCDEAMTCVCPNCCAKRWPGEAER